MDIFTKRGVDERVWRSRPYVRWEAGEVEDVVEADWAYGDLTGYAQGDLTRTVNAGPGWVMTRHPIPGRPPIMAELRPDEPIRQAPTTHTHSAPEQVHEGDRLYLHATSDDEVVRAEHEAAQAVCYVDHRHGNAKKYTFPMGEGRAARLDVHPQATDALKRGGFGRAWLCLEGVLNADALLSRGEVAMSVPGVTLWHGTARDEIDEVRGLYLGGARLYVATDSDWTNPNVVVNGLLAADTFGGLPVVPPTVDGDPKTGVGDYLATPGSAVDDLLCVRLLLPWRFVEAWEVYRSRIDRRDVRANVETVLRWLIVHSTARGLVQASSETIARSSGMERRTVNNTLNRLADDLGVLRLVEPEHRRHRPGWLKHGGWETIPRRFVIADPALRADYQHTPIRELS